MDKQNGIILPTNSLERLSECLKKECYGISQTFYKKVYKNISKLKFGDNLYLKLNSNEPGIYGVYEICQKPFGISVENYEGVFYKVNLNNLVNLQGLPWWIAEGFSILVFFKKEKEQITKLTQEVIKEKKLEDKIYDYNYLNKDENDLIKICFK